VSSDDIIRRLAIEQRKRLVASILGHAERELFPQLTPVQQRQLRDKVLSSVNAYHDFMLDVIRVGADDGVRNTLAIDLLQQVHASQRRLEAVVGP
jgi:hypothetical protein